MLRCSRQAQVCGLYLPPTKLVSILEISRRRWPRKCLGQYARPLGRSTGTNSPRASGCWHQPPTHAHWHRKYAGAFQDLPIIKKIVNSGSQQRINCAFAGALFPSNDVDFPIGYLLPLVRLNEIACKRVDFIFGYLGTEGHLFKQIEALHCGDPLRGRGALPISRPRNPLQPWGEFRRRLPTTGRRLDLLAIERENFPTQDTQPRRTGTPLRP